jgi:hypothetical protein
MNVATRLVLWNPTDTEFPLDAWEVLGAWMWAIPPRRCPEWSEEEFFRAHLNKPDLERVCGLLDGIARRHGLQADEDGRLAALRSVLLAGEELRVRRGNITTRLRGCEAAGDVRGQTRALKELARLEPWWFDNWSDLITLVEKTQSSAAALDCLRPAEPYQDKEIGFRLEKLRLICACSTREEALAEGRRFREDFGDVWELLLQGDEEYLLAWRGDPDAEQHRASFTESDD